MSARGVCAVIWLVLVLWAYSCMQRYGQQPGQVTISPASAPNEMEGLASPPTSSDIKRLMPPTDKRGNTTAKLTTMSNEQIRAHCGDGQIACARVGGADVWLPNPCAYARREWFALLACHELGHTNGWSHGGNL